MRKHEALSEDHEAPILDISESMLSILDILIRHLGRLGEHAGARRCTEVSDGNIGRQLELHWMATNR
jgi:hypothetical protein